MPKLPFSMTRRARDRQARRHAFTETRQININEIDVKPLATVTDKDQRTSYWFSDGERHLVDRGPFDDIAAVTSWARPPAKSPRSHPFITVLTQETKAADVFNVILAPEWQWPNPDGTLIANGSLSWRFQYDVNGPVIPDVLPPEQALSRRAPSLVEVISRHGPVQVEHDLAEEIDVLVEGLHSYANGRLLMWAVPPKLVLDPLKKHPSLDLTLGRRVKEDAEVVLFDLSEAQDAFDTVARLQELTGKEIPVTAAVKPHGSARRVPANQCDAWRRLAGPAHDALTNAATLLPIPLAIAMPLAERLAEIEYRPPSDVTMAEWLDVWAELRRAGGIPPFSQGADHRANRLAKVDAVIRYAIERDMKAPVRKGAPTTPSGAKANLTRISDSDRFPKPITKDVERAIDEASRVAQAAGPDFLETWDRLRQHADDPQIVCECLEILVSLDVEGTFRSDNSANRWFGPARDWILALVKEWRTYGMPDPASPTPQGAILP